ncbi:MAG TPA: hypothetical protein VMZ52_11080, partial [Bryobacteraceae bacterium]|nr:hypothetical protein [Bryobacteraceae bacterium]
MLVRVLLIDPNPPEVTAVFGLLQFGWFAALKASNLNWRYWLSNVVKFLRMDASQLKMPGPINVLRP